MEVLTTRALRYCITSGRTKQWKNAIPCNVGVHAVYLFIV